jgi:hypothetical protein
LQKLLVRRAWKTGEQAMSMALDANTSTVTDEPVFGFK